MKKIICGLVFVVMVLTGNCWAAEDFNEARSQKILGMIIQDFRGDSPVKFLEEHDFSRRDIARTVGHFLVEVQRCSNRTPVEIPTLSDFDDDSVEVMDILLTNAALINGILNFQDSLESLVIEIKDEKAKEKLLGIQSESQEVVSLYLKNDFPFDYANFVLLHMQEVFPDFKIDRERSFEELTKGFD